MTVILLGLVFSCQREAPAPAVELPGLSPFLQAEPLGLTEWLAEHSTEEKLQHLLVLKTGGAEVSAAALGTASGCWLTSADTADLNRFDQLWEARRPFPPFKLTGLNRLPSHLFGKDQWMPSLEAMAAIGDDSLRARLNRAYLDQAKALGLSWLSIPGYGMEGGATLLPPSAIQNQARWVNRLNEAHLVPIAAPFADFHLLGSDTTKVYRQAFTYHKTLIEAGLGGFWLPVEQLTAAGETGRLAGLFRNELQFGGLLIAEVKTEAQVSAWLKEDVDLLVIEAGQYMAALQALKSAYRKGVLSDERLDQKLTKILKARAWAGDKPAAPEKAPAKKRALEASVAGAAVKEPPVSLSRADYFQSESWPVWQRRAYAASIVLASNPEQRVPLPSGSEEWAILHLPGTVYDRHFEQIFGHYANYRSVRSWAEAATADRLVVLLDNYRLQAPDFGQLDRIREQAEVVIVNLGHPVNLQQLSRQEVVVQAFGNGDLEKELTAQLLFGGIPAEGRLPLTYSPDFLIGQGAKTLPTRLEYGLPQQAGMQPQRLVGIDAIVQSAIDEGATPGAQVLVAKAGKVIYHKAFGHHTYDEEHKVQLSDLYDVASITKIAATTLVAMQQYEAGKLKTKDRLRDHLPLPSNSRLRNLTLQKLMTHRSGLQPHLPVIPYLLAREADNDNCTDYFCNAWSPEFAVPVADSFYFSSRHHDEIWKDMQHLRGRRTRYRYSDANFVLTQHVVEALGGHRLDTLATESFYEPLGLRHTQFTPLRQHSIEQIIPTELDYRWRHQLVHGFVHDETAALLGGVAGHAGLFSNAQDLAVLFQMLLNGGTYGGQQFLKPETIEYFTSADHGNHRGLGFDKPEEEDIEERGYPKAISPRTYGHTGFTGTSVWVDPDEGLIYIFLSNRIHPDRSNRKLFTAQVRERIHNVIYDALGTFEPEWPELQRPLAASGQ
ncbi:serine hydrolase [Phaeodactylibacter sp.]|uniref:serine hydrolase domain-containing protein n=1 Tax=Phaeodactylibacter sp. TaxID=1940289 RepID=UPI0032F02252